LGNKDVSLFPRLRPFLAAISPTATGLSDYEFGRFVGTQFRDAGVHPTTLRSVLRFSRATRKPMPMETGQSLSAPLMTFRRGAETAQSPLVRNLLRGIFHRPRSGAAEYLLRHAMGPGASTSPILSNVAGQALHGAAIGALAGQPLAGASHALYGLPEALTIGGAYKGAPGLLSKVKAYLLRTGMRGQAAGKPRPLEYALRSLSPASNEAVLAGRDYGSMMDTARRIPQSRTSGLPAVRSIIDKEIGAQADTPLWPELRALMSTAFRRT
jgi:hypothetical protein